MLTQAEFEEFINDTTKQIDGNILWIEDFGGGLSTGTATLNLMFQDLISFDNWDEDELKLLDEPSDLENFFKDNSALHCAFLCRHYYDYVEFKENNNLFGMKMPEYRKTTAIGINRGHAVYSSWRESVIDYALWQGKRARYSTKNQYLRRLKSYAADPNYITKIKKRI
jgi:hypothetical protein